MEPAFLLADGEWFKILIFLLFILAPLIGNLFKGQPQAGGKPRRPQPGQPPAPQPGGGRKRLEAEIEAFLRQAGGQQPQREEQQPVRPQRPLGKPARTVTATAVNPQPTPLPPRRKKLASEVSQHVREHIEAHPVSERSAELGRQLSATDEKLESHLHEVFDHQLGQFELSSTSAPDAPNIREGTDAAVWQQQDRAAAEKQTQHARMDAIRALLSQPQGMQQAIVVSEILGRPTGLD